MNCPYCKKEAPWVSNEVVYGRRYGGSYMCYWCKDCDAYVGCHQNTKEPLGTMANKELRQWRRKVHDAIDPLWKTGKYTRKSVYRILSSELGTDMHVGSSNIEMCKKIIEAANNLMK